MRLTIANITTQISPADFQTAVRAIGQQVATDFFQEWGITAQLSGITAKLGKKLAPIQGGHSAIIYVGDSSTDPTTGVDNALGYHSANHKGVPYGFVYLDVVHEAHESWTNTLSHEVLELLADPSAVLSVRGPSPKKPGETAQFDLEVCDPTQGDSYEVLGVTVSNFVGKAYFGMPGGTGKTNFLDLDLDAFGVRPGGYFQYEEKGHRHEVDGPKLNQAFKLAKSRMKDGRRVVRREHDHRQR